MDKQWVPTIKTTIMRTYIIVFFIIITLSVCYYDHANLVYPQAPCTITTANYSQNVSGIITANCSSCHSGNASAGSGIKLDSYTALKTYVSNGQLMNSINHTGGIAVMPQNGQQLSSCDIKTIQTWIDNGTLNN